MLVKFEAGFSSPPHIHNITYKGIVLEGLVHNNHTTASKDWMPETSYWLQPAGQEHVTEADDLYNMAYIEIDSGPYLVEAVEEVFYNGETPINARAENLNWINLKNNLKLVSLWGANAISTPHGYMVKLPRDFKGRIKADAKHFHLVVIKGNINYHDKLLSKGSYIGNSGKFEIPFSTTNDSVIYIRNNGRVEIIQVQ